MSDDRRRPGQQTSSRDETLRRWIAEEVHPYHELLRAQLRGAGLGRREVRTAEDLDRLDITELAALGDGRRWVLAPTVEAIRSTGSVGMRLRLLVADVLGRRDGFARRDVDGPYKPVRWFASATADGTLFSATTSTDLDRLAVLGRRGLAISGVTVQDRLACTEPAGTGIGSLQLALGARDAGVACLAVDPDAHADVLAAAAPTVVSGTPASLARAIEDGLADGVRLLLVHASPSLDRDQIDALAQRSGRAVRVWWSPPGTRAAWVTCERGELHTWPEHEHLSTVDADGRSAESGRLVWSAVGWRGSVWLRVALGFHGTVQRDACACGRTTPRVRVAPAPAAAQTRIDAVVAEVDGVADWFAMRRSTGEIVLVVLPTSREVAAAARDRLHDATGCEVVLIGANRCARIRQIIGDVRDADERVIGSAMPRAARR